MAISLQVISSIIIMGYPNSNSHNGQWNSYKYNNQWQMWLQTIIKLIVYSTYPILEESKATCC